MSTLRQEQVEGDLRTILVGPVLLPMETRIHLLADSHVKVCGRVPTVAGQLLRSAGIHAEHHRGEYVR